jgi:hypothetical protein
MRILALMVVAISAVLTTGCVPPDGAMLQPPVQGEWSNFHNDKHQVTADARDEKPESASDKR